MQPVIMTRRNLGGKRREFMGWGDGRFPTPASEANQGSPRGSRWAIIGAFKQQLARVEPRAREDTKKAVRAVAGPHRPMACLRCCEII